MESVHWNTPIFIDTSDDFWTAFYWEVWERRILVELQDFSVESFLLIYLILVL